MKQRVELPKHFPPLADDLPASTRRDGGSSGRRGGALEMLWLTTDYGRSKRDIVEIRFGRVMTDNGVPKKVQTQLGFEIYKQ